MRDAELLVQDILDNKIEIKELSADELDIVVDSLVEIGEGLIGTEHHDVGVAMLKALDIAIDMYSTNEDFEKSIVAAEQCGSTYWEIENPSIH